MVAQFGVNVVGKVQNACSNRKIDALALWSKDNNSVGNHVQLEVIDKIDSRRGIVIQQFSDLREPIIKIFVQFTFLDLLIFVVSRQSLFCNLVHSLTSYLNLDPLSLFAHHSAVKSLITIAFGIGKPVSETIELLIVHRRYDRINRKAGFLFHRLRNI